MTGVQTCALPISPISAGQRVGTIRLSLAGRPFGEHAAVALESVEVAGILGRLWDTMRLWLN